MLYYVIRKTLRSFKTRTYADACRRMLKYAVLGDSEDTAALQDADEETVLWTLNDNPETGN